MPGLNESPSEKEGKFAALMIAVESVTPASMKALPKRKGNQNFKGAGVASSRGLNESPSEKEGKFPPGMLGASNSETPQ